MESLVAWLGGLTAAGWLCAGFAGLAAFGLVRPPPQRRGRGGRCCPAGGRRGRAGCAAGTADPASDGGWRWVRRPRPASVWPASSVAGGPGWWIWLGWPVATVLAAVLLGAARAEAALGDVASELISDTPQALELMATGLAAGMPVRLAGRVVADAFDSAVGEDLGRVLALVDLGVSDAEAWRTLHDHPQLGPAAQDLSRSVESGTMMVEALRRHAAAAREARRAGQVIRARSVGVRSVLPLMICFIPSFLLLGVVPTVVSSLVAALG